jgi:hypothetical protein
MVESSNAPYQKRIFTLMTGDDFIREAKRHGHGFVAKPCLNSDLVSALYATIEGSFFVSDLSR